MIRIPDHYPLLAFAFGNARSGKNVCLIPLPAVVSPVAGIFIAAYWRTKQTDQSRPSGWPSRFSGLARA